MADAQEVKLSIPMLPDMEVTAFQTADAVLRHMAFAPEQIDDVKHALAEACLNAFEHSGAPGKALELLFRMDDSQVVVVIQDPGGGFNPHAVPRPVVGEKASDGSRKRGWGLVMMEALMDQLSIQTGPEGTRITMVKRRDSGEGPAA